MHTAAFTRITMPSEHKLCAEPGNSTQAGMLMWQRRDVVARPTAQWYINTWAAHSSRLEPPQPLGIQHVKGYITSLCSACHLHGQLCLYSPHQPGWAAPHKLFCHMSDSIQQHRPATILPNPTQDAIPTLKHQNSQLTLLQQTGQPCCIKHCQQRLVVFQLKLSCCVLSWAATNCCPDR